MILKTLDQRKSETSSGVYDEWNYFDNIVSASNYFNEDSNQTCVRCKFADGNFVIIDVPCVAYLMSDSGKTIDKIYGVTRKELGSTEEAVHPTMQDAVEYAKNAD